MTLSPTNSRWSSLLFLYVLAFVSCMLVPLSKKIHLDFTSFLCYFVYFPASNSLQIIQLIPCISLWDLICLVSWGNKKLLSGMNSVSPDWFLRSNRINSVPPIAATRCYIFQSWDKLCVTCILHICPSSTLCNLSSTSINTTRGFEMWLQDQTYLTHAPEAPSWKLMSKGEREHTLQKKTHPWHFGPNEFFIWR